MIRKPEKSVSTNAESSIPSTVKHISGKAKDLQVKFQENALSDNENGENNTEQKSRFGFKSKPKKIKRSNSNVVSASLKEQEIYQMEQDLLAIELKICNSENLKNMIQEDYYQKKSKYIEALEQLNELKKYKDETKNQMWGFLVMYELKREQTLKDLSQKLKQTPGYQYENLLK